MNIQDEEFLYRDGSFISEESFWGIEIKEQCAMISQYRRSPK